MNIESTGQTAAIAASHAHYLAGDPLEAGELLEKHLGKQGRTFAQDVWQRYPGSRRGQVAELLGQLHEKACR